MAKIRRITEMEKIDPSILYKLLTEYDYPIGQNAMVYRGWKMIDRKLTSSDAEDGGSTYDVVIQNVESGKLYQTSYCDWDIENTDFEEGAEDGHEIDEENGRCDLNCNLIQVLPVTKTIIVYEPVNKNYGYPV